MATSTGASLESDSGATLDIGNLATLDNVSLIIGGFNFVRGAQSVVAPTPFQVISAVAGIR